MRFPVTLTVATCSTAFGYFIGKNHSEEIPLSSFLIQSAFAKTSIPSNTNKLTPILPVKTNNARALEDINKYGFPHVNKLIVYEDFVLSYDKRNRIANWVLEHLTPEKLNSGRCSRRGIKFQEDISVLEPFRSTNDDYKGSGYDKGHLAAAANHKCSESALAQTFYLTNIAPQIGEGFNRDIWNNLEMYTRSKALKSRNVYVCTGPLFLPRKDKSSKMNYVSYEVIGDNHVAVPTHFFKVLLIENSDGDFEIESFIMPNTNLYSEIGQRPKNWMVSLDMIERASGLNLFPNLPRERVKKMSSRPSTPGN